MTILDTASGTFTGTKKLWFQDPEKPEISDAEISIAPGSVRYTWAFRGKPQSGAYEIVPLGDELRADFVDTWHSKTPMTCVGKEQENKISVLGYYGAGAELWGWRTELEAPSSDALTLRMFNVAPDGTESLAVELSAERQGST